MGIFSKIWENEAARNTIKNIGKDIGARIFAPALPALSSQAGRDLTAGAVKGAIHTATGLADIVPGVNVRGKVESVAQKLGTTTKPVGGAQKAGFVGEQIGEFLAPAGAARAGGVALATKIAPKAKSIETIANIIKGTGGLAAESLSQGAVGAAQDSNLGTGAKTAALNMAVTPALGAGTKLLGQVFKTASSALTSVQKGAIEQAYKEPRKVLSVMKEAFNDPDTARTGIVQKAQSALDDLLEQRRARYEQNLKRIADETYVTKNGTVYVKKPSDLPGKPEVQVPTTLTLKGVKDTFTKYIKNNFRGDASGNTLDLSTSTFPKTLHKDVQQVADEIYNWKDISPEGMDTLIRRINGYRRGGVNPGGADKQFNVLISGLADNLNAYINDRLPQVAKLRSDYAKQSQLINKVSEELTSGKDSTVGTRLMNLFSPNKASQRGIAEELKMHTDEDLLSEIAGTLLSQWTPDGLGKYLATVGGSSALTGATKAAASGALGPAIVPALAALPATAALASPKVVGTTAALAGMAAPKVEAGLNVVRPVGSAIAGKALSDEQPQEQIQSLTIEEKYPDYTEFITKARESGVSDEEIEAYLKEKLGE